MRDLFDSTVKADPISSGPRLEYESAVGAPPPLIAPPATLSGLPPTSAKAAYLERLEASRDWLKRYEEAKKSGFNESHDRPAARPVCEEEADV